MISKKILFLLTASMSSSALAVVTDVFNCKMAIVNSDGSELASQSNSVAIIRKPEGRRDGYIFTRGEARLSIQTKESNRLRIGYVQLVIRHAIKEDQSSGSAIAFQNASFSPETYFCWDPSCVNNPRDPGSRNPGSPEKHGSRVPVIDGVPSIDVNQIREDKMQFGSSPENGLVKSACEYIGTYR